MSAIPDGKVFVEVTDRPYPRGGNTHPPGAVLLLSDPAAEYACDEADPPFCERIPEEEAVERGLPRRFGLVEVAPETDEEETAPEPGTEALPYRFTPGARSVLVDAGVKLDRYDGPATGEEAGLVTDEDAESWLEESGAGETPPPTDRALEIADERGIDISEVEGTGTRGRVTASDVREHDSGEDGG